MPDKKPLPDMDILIPPEKPDDRIHKCGSSDERGDIRSETPIGFMRAVFHANFGGDL